MTNKGIELIPSIRKYWHLLIAIVGVIWWAATLTQTVTALEKKYDEQGRKIDAIYERLLPDRHSSLGEPQESKFKRVPPPTSIAKGD